MLQEILDRLQGGESLSQQEMARTMDAIMEGQWLEQDLALLLTALHAKGETVDELAGAAESLRRHMTRIRSRHREILDTCGTGGDRSGTFNISTAAALVTAAAGVPVAKHGNRSMTSSSGSADVLAQLGVNLDASVGQAEHCLDEIGICFCFAPLLHPSMRHVAAVRRQLKFPTIFNLLGPLCNPADACFQLLGVGQAQRRPLLSQALQRLGTRHALVVHGEDGLDEVSLAQPTQCSEIRDGGYAEFTWTPEEFGLARIADHAALRVESPVQSAALIREVLNDQFGPPRDIVVLNSAAALWTAGRGTDPRACAELARDAIRSGAALETLKRLAALSHA